MSDELRWGMEAGRLQRIAAMRLIRVVSAGLLSLFALVTCMAAAPSAQYGRTIVDSIAAARGKLPAFGAASDVERLLTSRTAGHSARLRVRHLVLARVRTADGDAPVVPLLATSRVELLGDIADSARTHLQRYAQRHLPYGDPSSFDATAPPTPGRRNG